jgi:NAD(P)-dependent dehydrogenase (short-subunit alcohol dehydrogenase family)
MRLKNRITPVTGSTTGIGVDMARVLVREGAQAVGMVGVTVAARLIAKTGPPRQT